MNTAIRIGETHVDFTLLSIEGPAGKFSMEPKVMSLLQVLVNNAGAVVTRAELLDQVWREGYGSDESLSRAVSLLRKAFGEVRGGKHYIETVPKRGYRLTAEVSVDEPQQTATESKTPQTPLADQQLTQPKPTVGKLPVLALALGLIVALLVAYLFLSGEQVSQHETVRPAIVEETSADILVNKKSIAVLPFEDLSSDGAQQYLSDGLAEEILNALVRFPDLRVMGRTSSFTFREPELNLDKINSALAVSHVLTGSLRKQGSRVRITARLVQAKDGHNLWSDSYDGDISEIFDLQEKIAREIARNLGVVLDLSAQQRFVPKLTNNRQAYDLFLQGRELARKFGQRNKSKAIELLERAVLLDPNFSAAWAWLGQANLYLTLTAQGGKIPEIVAAARTAVDRSLLLDPDLAIGHYVRTVLLDYDLDFAGSMDEVEKAFQLNPFQPFLAIRRGNAYGVIGLSQTGAELMERGLVWDPTDSVGLLNYAVAKKALGQVDSATSLTQRSVDLGFVPAAGQLCYLLKQQQRNEAALNCWNALSDNFRQRYRPVFNNEQQWAMLGRAMFLEEPSAQHIATQALDEYFSQQGSRANTYLLQIYVSAAAPERFMQTFVSHPYPLNSGAISGIWDDMEVHRELRDHPDFPAFAEHIGLLRAWQKYGWPDRCQKFSGTDGSGGQFSCDF